MKIKNIFTILFLHLSLMSFAENKVEEATQISAQNPIMETEKTEKVVATTDFAKWKQGDEDDEFSYSRRLRRFHAKNRRWSYFAPYYTSNVYYTINTPAWGNYYYTSFSPVQISQYSYFAGLMNVSVMYMPTYYNVGYYYGGSWGSWNNYASFYNGDCGCYSQGYYSGNANNWYNSYNQTYNYDAFYWKKSQNNGNSQNLVGTSSVNNPRSNFEKNPTKNVKNSTSNVGLPTELPVKHTELAQTKTQPNFAHNPNANVQTNVQTPRNQDYSNYSTPKKGYESVNVKSNVENVYTNPRSNTPKTVHSYENPQIEHSSKDFSKHEGSYAQPSSWESKPRTTQNGQQTVSFENKPKHYATPQSVSFDRNQGNEGRVKVPQLKRAGLSYKTPFEIVP